MKVCYLVFITTATWASFAYIWLYIVLVVITPNEVTLWEALLTLLFFPILIIHSYMAEKNFFLKKNVVEKEVKQLLDLCMNFYNELEKFRFKLSPLI